MAFTKIQAAGIGSTETVTLHSLSVINNATIGGVLTYEDVTNVDSIGLITARNGVVVGTGITLSKDGDVFFTGIATGNGSGLTNLPAANITGTLPAISGANLTNLTAGNLTGALPAISGANLTGLNVGIATTSASMSGITTVLDLSKDDFRVTAAGITTIDVRGGEEGQSKTLRIVNSGITTVGFSTYFLFPSGGTPDMPTTDGAISLISFTVHRQGAVGLATQLISGASVNFS
tara:strand:+ start:259 stop:960 length:702 start_codon:yes stop_codon:yes gene_type:complete